MTARQVTAWAVLALVLFAAWLVLLLGGRWVLSGSVTPHPTAEVRS